MIAIERPGTRYGRLIVVGQAPSRRRKAFWLCRCDCGRQIDVYGNHLRRGHTRSCGCLVGDNHGASATPEYRSWASMFYRCDDPTADSYRYYGARGIGISTAWRESFPRFLADMGDRPAGMTLDRIDPNGNYEADNCRWATVLDQNNNRRNQIWVEWDGDRRRLSDLCRARGLSMSMVRNRIVVLGWDLMDALSTPPRPKNKPAEKHGRLLPVKKA